MAEGEKPGAPEPVQPPAIKPIPLNLIGVREEGTGVPITDGQVIVTPDHQPNIVANVVQPIVAILVRVTFLYAKTVLGFLTIAMVPPGDNPVLKAMHAIEFWQLLTTAAGIAIAPAGYELLQSIVTILGRLERKYPLLTGSI